MELNNILLSLIALLISLCAYFLARMVAQFDKLKEDVEKIEHSFLLFRQKVSMLLSIPDHDDPMPLPRPKPTKR